jgi:hypothetical protein
MFRETKGIFLGLYSSRSWALKWAWAVLALMSAQMSVNGISAHERSNERERIFAHAHECSYEREYKIYIRNTELIQSFYDCG